MKKITIFMAILALAFMAVPALALTNIVVNGDFNTGNLTGWTNGGIADHVGFGYGPAYLYAWTPIVGEAVMYQICDASTGGGWIAGGTSETYNFSFQYGKYVSGNTAEYGIWYSTNATAPAFGGPDNPGAGWTLLSENTALPVASYWTTVSLNGTLTGIQPQWFAVAFEGTTSYPYAVGFDNVSLTTQCSASAVPVPPSALLLGSGLLGLVGWRRLRKA
jgi:hypothetical protein